MKKGIIAAVAVVSAGLLAFTGCSKKAKKSEKITLTVWESLLGPDEFIKQAGAKYTESHPNVEIKFVNVELGDSTGQIALDGPAGVGADLFAAPHDKLGELVNGGHVAPTANADVFAQEVLGACSKALTYEGKMYGYPVSAETYALFYNKDLIAEKDVPKTWDDLAKWAIEFNKKNPDKRGFVMDVGNAYYSIVFTTENGNRIFGSTGADTSTTYLNNDDAVNGMKFFQSLRNALDVPAADLSTGVCDAAFQGGQAAMHITGPWNVKNFVDAKLNFGVAPLPSLPGDTVPAASFSGTRAMFVSSYSDHPEEAADFAQFLISPAMQQLRFDITGAMPAINVKVSSEYIGGFLNQLDYAFPMPSVPQMSAFWDALGNASKNIWNGADVKKELDACNATILGM
ncbi:maltose ABC transporter substrate-binding protein [uncultured Treponema sp.]|uniref:sugar ABC transporter substrate-binding protein n=1 Tax=uncultured Treponema sp. TaxID=162155 RepID=UPI0025DA89E1|nr:maltose ABC transporter substrate-binding protein [uncultured Treponema sp.]